MNSTPHAQAADEHATTADKHAGEAMNRANQAALYGRHRECHVDGGVGRIGVGGDDGNCSGVGAGGRQLGSIGRDVDQPRCGARLRRHRKPVITRRSAHGSRERNPGQRRNGNCEWRLRNLRPLLMKIVTISDIHGNLAVLSSSLTASRLSCNFEPASLGRRRSSAPQRTRPPPRHWLLPAARDSADQALR